MGSKGITDCAKRWQKHHRLKTMKEAAMFLKLSKKKKPTNPSEEGGGREVPWRACLVKPLVSLLCLALSVLSLSLKEIKVLCWLKISVERKYFNFSVEE